MQRWAVWTTEARLFLFQCPLRWAGRCNERRSTHDDGIRLFQCPLRWAGRCNCGLICEWVDAVLLFQCPLRWAGRCNIRTAAMRERSRWVSVPSSLGREMQPCCSRVCRPRIWGFSALFVGQGDATPRRRAGSPSLSVSVPSSLGREMQLSSAQHFSQKQFPVSVPSSLGREMQRGGSPPAQKQYLGVSVPSSLGREMQLVQYDLGFFLFVARFSALFVGQGDATTAGATRTRP